MVAMPAVEPPAPGGEDLLQMFLALDTPPGYRAELIEGEIVVTPPPDGNHESAFAFVNRQLLRDAEIDVHVSGTKGLITPGGRFVPDGTVCPVGWLKNAEPWADPSGVLLVFEVTSTNPHKDRVQKRRGYAAAGIPCYLLVDRGEGLVTLFTQLVEGDYTDATRVPFGEPLDLPAPFSFKLDTGPLR